MSILVKQFTLFLGLDDTVCSLSLIKSVNNKIPSHLQISVYYFEAHKAVMDALQTALGRFKRTKKNGGSTYVRWGRTSCPSTSELVYDVYAGGGNHVHSWAGTNYLRLPKDPQQASDTTPSYKGYVHGAEYHTHGTFLGGIKDHEVP